MTAVPRVVVVGAGIAGLSVAYDLQTRGIDAQVLDAAPAPGPITAALAVVATRLRLPWVPGSPTPWRYRRLVLEPVPYALDAEACRALLDTAIEAATACFERLEGLAPEAAVGAE